MAEGALLEFSDMNFSNDVLGSTLPVVVDFWAEWCGPCKMLTPLMVQLVNEFKGKVNLGKLNIDDNPETAAKYGITSIPTVLFFSNGKVVDQQVGLLALPALRKKITNTFFG